MVDQPGTEAGRASGRRRRTRGKARLVLRAEEGDDAVHDEQAERPLVLERANEEPQGVFELVSGLDVGVEDLRASGSGWGGDGGMGQSP